MTGYFEDLEHELAAAAGRRPAANRRGRRVALLAAALVVLAGVPALATQTHVFSSRPPAIREIPRPADQQVIAQGRTRDGRPWQLRGSQSRAGLCLSISLPSGDPKERAPAVAASCGGAKPGSLTLGFTFVVLGHGNPRGQPRALVQGTTPDAAVRVRLRAGALTRTVRTVDDHFGAEGRFYVIELPTRLARGHLRVFALDRSGKVIRTASR